jgi:hypothetical protein
VPDSGGAFLFLTERFGETNLRVGRLILHFMNPANDRIANPVGGLTRSAARPPLLPNSLWKLCAKRFTESQDMH